MDKTSIYNMDSLKEELLLLDLKEVISSLKLKGYNPSSQILGFLLTDDATFITSFNNSREKVKKYSKDEIIYFLIKYFEGEI